MRPEGGCAGRVLALLALLAVGGGAAKSRADGLIEGLDSWSDAVTARTTSKWVGQRVAAPEPSPRPESSAQLTSALWPLSVHLTRPPRPKDWEQARAVLRSAEATYALLSQSGLFSPHGDAGNGGTFQRDLYLVDGAFSGARLDETLSLGGLDAARSYAIVDARTPSAQRDVCIAQALLEAELVELDPAESAIVRSASAAYFARLLSDETCGALAETDALSFDRGVLTSAEALTPWLWALSARQDQNRGVFLQSMWHFARQRTWEGSGLRGSPDLLEAIAKTLELSHEKLEEVAGELANASALASWSESSAPIPLPSQRAVRWSALPAHLAATVPLRPLDSSFRLIDLEAERVGERLVVWSRGEPGTRWALSATRLRADGTALSTVNAPVRKTAESELHLELTQGTRFVLLSVTNLGSGIPDPDRDDSRFERSTRLIVDHGR